MKNLIICFLLIIVSSINILSQLGWIPQNSGSTNGLGYISFINENTGFTGGPFIKTTNGGQNWNNISVNAFDMVCFVNNNTGYGAAGGQFVWGTIYKTINGGNNWANIGGCDKRIVRFVNPDSGIAVGGDQGWGVTLIVVSYKTTNGGVTWDSTVFPYLVPNTGIWMGSFTSLHIFNAANIYAALYNENEEENTMTRVYKTTNFGINWFGVHDIDSMYILKMQYTSLDTGYCIERECTLNNYMPWLDYIYKITNNNYTPVYQAPNENVHLNGLYFVNNSTGYVCGTGGLILKTTNGGLIWLSQNSGTLNDLLDITFVNSNTGYIAGGGGIILKTTTGGEPPVLYSISGTVRYQDNSQPVSSGKVKALKYDPITQQIQVLDSAVIQSNGTYLLAHVPSDSVDIMAFQDDEEAISYVPTYYVSTIYWRESNTLFPTSNLTNININVYRRTSGGDNKSISGYIYNGTSMDYDFLNGARVYAKLGGNYKGYSVSNANGLYLIDSLSNGTYEVIVDRMGFYPATQFAYVNGGNITNFNFTLLAVLSAGQTGNSIPSHYKLYQNYPNPFNPQTEIHFGLPKESEVNLVIFDLLGREIAVLANGSYRAGEYKVLWNSQGFSSGIYFYRLSAGDFSDSKKIVLIK